VAHGAVLPAGVVLGDAVSVGPNAVFVAPSAGEGLRPASAQAQVQVGAGAVIYPGITLAAGVIVRPGSVVNRSVPHGAIVEGNPATIVGYVAAPRQPAAALPTRASSATDAIRPTGVRGVSLYHLPVIPDLRGNLTVGEFDKQIPFVPKRYFIVFGVPSRETRGEHAHRECHQFLLCLRGNCAVVADDGQRRVEVTLDSVNTGLHLPPMVWGIQYRYSADAMLMVFASHHYDPADYIRDYDEFLRAVGAGR
jgi:dTDP-4-dehydrorhamnose 3,5-epimerase-like enzyme